MSGNLAWPAALQAAAVAALAFAAGALVGHTEASGWTQAVVGGAVALAGAVVAFVSWWGLARATSAVVRTIRSIDAGERGARVHDPSRLAGPLVLHVNRLATRLDEVMAAAEAEAARVRATFDATGAGIVAIGYEGTIELANAAASTMLELAPGTFKGRRFIEAVRDYELAALVEAALRGESSARVLAFGPQRLPLRAEARPIQGGGSWAALLVLTDLTEVQRTEQLRRDFISNVSHELRTPLAAMRALAETLEQDAMEPETREVIARILGQVDRMNALVNELLDLSRIEAGAIPLNVESVPVREATAEAVNVLEPRANAAGVHFTVDIAEDAVAAADRQALVRMLTNLLDNAVKYSPREGTVRVTGRRGGESVEISVEDEGPGIAPEHLPRVFERFYKGDPSRASEGVGLGLAIVKHLARAHGGSVKAENRPEGGARFTIVLAAAD